MPRDRRRWTSTLASDLPEGPEGQPAHKAGTSITVIHAVVLPEVGMVAMSVPRPSSLLLDVAEGHIKRAARIRKQLPRQVKRGRWIQPGLELDFTNEELLFDYFEEAMAGVLLTHTALDNFANEWLPPDFVMPDRGGGQVGRVQIEGGWGVLKRLHDVLPVVTGKPSIRDADEATWVMIEKLKNLRDSIGHIHLDETYTQVGDDAEQSLFSRLLATDLAHLFAAVERTMTYYSEPPQGLSS